MLFVEGDVDAGLGGMSICGLTLTQKLTVLIAHSGQVGLCTIKVDMYLFIIQCSGHGYSSDAN